MFLLKFLLRTLTNILTIHLPVCSYNGPVGVTDGESSASKEAEGAGANTGEYSLAFDMRQVVMAGINEINEEVRSGT